MNRKFLSTLINLISNQAPISKFKKLRLGIFLGQLEIRSIRNSSGGFSVIEVILAAALFMIIAAGSITVILQGLDSNRLGEEQTIANQFAAEGIEAMRSIKNQAYTPNISTLSASTRRVFRNNLGVWGTMPAPPNDTMGKFTRTIQVDPVNRDNPAPPLGNIVVSGTNDPDTKKITSTVSWNFSPTRSNSVQLISYLSDWKKAIAPTTGNALAIYGDTTSLAQPKYRLFTDSTNTFNTEAAAGSTYTDTIVGKNFFVQTNPTKPEAVAGYVNNLGVLRILCFDGTTWTSEWTVTVGGTGTNDGRFGIAFEKTSGDAMVVYSTNTATTNEMAYRTKAGSTGCGSANWPAATNITAARTNGIVHWIRMENSPVTASNNIALAWADAASDLSAMIWTGAGWTIAEPTAALEIELERVTTSQDSLSFDIAFESTSGNLMVAWGIAQAAGCTAQATDTATLLSTNCIRYTRYTTSWGVVRVIPVVADPATNIDLASNPNTNELVLASVDNSQADLSQAYWSGSAWTGKANQDTTAQAVTAGSKRVATGWLIAGETTRSITVYNDSGTTNVGWVMGNAGTFTTQTDFAPTPVFANPQTWYRLEMDPVNKDRLMFILSDNGSDLFAKRLVMTSVPGFTWTNSDDPDGGGAGTGPLEASLGQTSSSPFGFAYWRNP